jgi:hypothetical protein
MHPSMIVTIDAEALTEESGYVLLGTIDGLAYVHLAPYTDPSSRASWIEAASVLYDPSPDPFRWAEFAAAHPDLGASLGNDVDGNPLPSALMPHQWAGE